MIIERPEEIKRLNETKKWTLVYGRRKTGKSFLVENFLKFDEYFFVKKDRSIISKKDDNTITYETLVEIVKRGLVDGKIIVVDEFHRLGDDFFDFLHSSKKEGRLILISSTLFLSKKLFSSHSALLGLLSEHLVWIIDFEDCIKTLKKFKLEKKDLVESATLIREPLAVDYFSEEQKPREMFSKIVLGSIKTIPALVGEIFTEEERGISSVYTAILKAVASGKVTSGEISSYVFSRRLTSKDDPSLIQPYLSNLLNLGILKRIEIYGKKRFVYKHLSPLVRLFYYADEKYNISEKRSKGIEIERIIDEIMPRIVEDNIREVIAYKKGLTETVIEGKDYEVDGCLLKFKKPEIALEVKWKNKITEEDVKKAEKNLEMIDAKEKWLFVPDKKMVKCKTSLRVVDISDI